MYGKVTVNSSILFAVHGVSFFYVIGNYSVMFLLHNVVLLE